MAAFNAFEVIRQTTAGLRTLLVRPDWFARVTPGNLRDDLFAGITGATIVLPQGIAFAAIAGLPPEYGFYTAMVTPVVAAIFGSSWHAVSGPTTAISALVFGALSGLYVPGSAAFIQAAITLALLVGLIQLALGLARLGGLVEFVSHSVMTGFIAGAALLIGLSQLKYVLGLDLPRPEHLLEYIVAVWVEGPGADLRSISIGSFAFIVGYAVKKYSPKMPNYVIAILCATGLYFILGGTESDVATVGVVKSASPQFNMPTFSITTLSNLGSAAVAIALVGLLEAMSIARAIATRSGQTIDGNKEFMGQGASNIVGSFFNCYPGSASFTRSGVNFDAGAKTPLAAVFSAVFLFAILYLVAPYFAYVPIPALAGVIILVAIKLVDIKEITHIFRTSRNEAWIAIVTFLSAIFIDLEFAIYSGVLLSLAMFLNATSRPFIGIGAPDPESPGRVFKSAERYNLDECPQMVVARLDGPLYFGSVSFVRRQFRRIEAERPLQKHMIFIVKGVGEIDLPGAELLIEEADRRKVRGGGFHLQTRTPRTISKLGRFQVMKSLTKEHIHLSKRDAIVETIPLLDQSICATCTKRIFNECPATPDFNVDTHPGDVT